MYHISRALSVLAWLVSLQIANEVRVMCDLTQNNSIAVKNPDLINHAIYRIDYVHTAA